MKLVELDENTFQDLKTKQICLVEKSISYLDELIEKYNILSNIMVIVDENRREQGELFYRNKKIEVRPLEYLEELNLNETAVIITSDYYKEYVKKIDNILKDPNRMDAIYVFFNHETRIEMLYRNKYKNMHLQNIIVFRSGPHSLEYVEGMDFSDNARALFEYMLTVKLNQIYELVWFVKDPEEFEHYLKYDNVSFIPYYASNVIDSNYSEAYYRALCLAKYIFFTDAYGFARNCRKDQIRVQLWHGCGFKTRLNFTVCEERYEYMTVTSKLYAKIHAKIFGLRMPQLLITGCAKEDWLFEEDKNYLSNLGIPKADKYIFWLPTYRFSAKNKPRDGSLGEETGLPLLKSVRELFQLNSILAYYNIVMVIKLHPFQNKKAMFCQKFSNIMLLDNHVLYEKNIQINQLLSRADALISDYSSVAIDFLVLDRPIGFIVDDVGEYGELRGFIFENILDHLPGKCIFKKRELLDFIGEIAVCKDSDKSHRRKLTPVFHEYTDNRNCERIVKALGM